MTEPIPGAVWCDVHETVHLTGSDDPSETLGPDHLARCHSLAKSDPCSDAIEAAANETYVDEPLVAARNAGMDQLFWREVDEEEPLSMMEIGGINIWMDAEHKVVILDVPPGYRVGTVGR